MDTKVVEIAPEVYRLSTYLPEYRMAVNQFLIADDEPFMMHAGFKSMFPSASNAVASILQGSPLRWIGFSHFESDECSALNQWLELYPGAQAAVSFVGAMVNLGDFAIRPARALADGEVLETGRHRIRFLSTPHLPHGWDAGLYFDEQTRVLLCSDLLFHPGDPEPLTSSDIVERAEASIMANRTSPFANDMPYTPYTDQNLQRLAELKPKILALMHGSSFAGDCETVLRRYAEVVRRFFSVSE